MVVKQWWASFVRSLEFFHAKTNSFIYLPTDVNIFLLDNSMNTEMKVFFGFLKVCEH